MLVEWTGFSLDKMELNIDSRPKGKRKYNSDQGQLLQFLIK